MGEELLVGSNPGGTGGRPLKRRKKGGVLRGKIGKDRRAGDRRGEGIGGGGTRAGMRGVLERRGTVIFCIGRRLQGNRAKRWFFWQIPEGISPGERGERKRATFSQNCGGGCGEVCK